MMVYAVVPVSAYSGLLPLAVLIKMLNHKCKRISTVFHKKSENIVLTKRRKYSIIEITNLKRR
jgi:hypothetical protein